MNLYEFFISPFQYEFMRNALWVSIIAGVLAPVTGFWALNRRMVYLMDAMTHSVLPGVILAAIFGFSYLTGGLMAAVLLAFIVFLLTKSNKAPEDGAIGVGSQTLFASGVLLASQSTDSRSFAHILFGNPFSTTSNDIVFLGITALISISLIRLMQSQLIASTFDHEHATAVGVNVIRVDLVLTVALAATTVVGLSSVGTLMTISLGITPAITMRVLGICFMKARYGSVAIGVFCSASGILASFHTGIPAGPAVALICSFVLLLALFGSYVHKELSRRKALVS